MGQFLAGRKRALGDIEELQRMEMGTDVAEAPRIRCLLEDARTELGKAIGLVEQIRGLSKSD